MTLDQLRPHLGFILGPLTRLSIRAGLTPNSFSVMAFLASVAAGIAFFLGQMAAAIALVSVNALFDALDGSIARELQLASPRGDFLDHVLDRYADIFIITGIFAGGQAPWIIGVFALTGVLMSSYLGTQAQAVGIGRYYGGTLGRADRLLLIIVAGLLTLALPAGYAGLSFLGWLLVVFGIFGHATAVQRFFYVWGKIR
ncbi:MAG TPA: CDP-alcohol phosphatidyltransferase family protein [Methanomicrobiales archaeon]|jgi:archaetidylinositol phosphate synthase|nr:CDP-alcohol phosphatidyltransferase family protein [Methanomicrobiales archaeon]